MGHLGTKWGVRSALVVFSLLGVVACGGDGGGGTTDSSGGGPDVPPVRTDVPPVRTDVAGPEMDTASDSGALPEDVAEDVAEDIAEDAVADDVPFAEDVPPDVDPNVQPPHQREAFEPPTGALRAGVAVGYLDGPVGTSMAGYGGRVDGAMTAWSKMLKGTRGFYNAQSVKAMALEVGGERVVLLKSPMMSSETSVTYATIRRLREMYDLDLEGRLLMGATHSHHAPLATGGCRRSSD